MYCTTGDTPPDKMPNVSMPSKSSLSILWIAFFFSLFSTSLYATFGTTASIYNFERLVLQKQSLGTCLTYIRRTSRMADTWPVVWWTTDWRSRAARSMQASSQRLAIAVRLTDNKILVPVRNAWRLSIRIDSYDLNNTSTIHYTDKRPNGPFITLPHGRSYHEWLLEKKSAPS
jgi:hypothetical protein